MTDAVLDTIIAGGFSVVVVLVQKLTARVDGRLTELLDLTRKSSHAEGMKDEGEERDSRK
jgi:hypothetical protein